MDARLEEMRALVARLNAAADAYYGGRGELMTDFEWDALFDRVRALEAETGTVLPESPTHRVSAEAAPAAGERESHEFAALSLAKTKKVDEVVRWAEGRPIWLSWKLDGLTLVVTYDGGRLTKVVTRGDGHVGTNITHLAEGIAGIPRSVPEKGHLVVRGEAVISYADFAAFAAESQEDYANPRNLASGSLTLKDVEELKRRHLKWIPFTLVKCDREIVSWGARMDWLDALGFGSVERERLDAPDAVSVGGAIARWTEKVTGGANPFPVDGLVVAYDDTAYAATGSVTGHHATRGGLAFKWQDETAETELEEIEWSCAAGSICPVAVFRPVQLEGTTVRRASLCNVSECERLGIGGRGTRLEVIKSNKIIPKVVAVTAREGAFEIPVRCPVCGAPTEVRVSPTQTRTLRCTNARCAAKQLAKYERFVSKAGMDIDGLAVDTLAKFVNRGWIRSFADIYRLDGHLEELAATEGFGEKSAGNLRAALANARRRDAVNFLNALSIPLCGPDVARRILGAFSLEEIMAEAERSEDGAAFAEVDGIGPAKGAALAAWFRDGENRSVVRELLERVEIVRTAVPTGGRCAGLTFVVTGDVARFANRAAFKAYVLSQGGKVTGSVSKATDFLVNNDVTSTTGKNLKARELGVPVISEDDFVSRFGGMPT